MTATTELAMQAKAQAFRAPYERKELFILPKELMGSVPLPFTSWLICLALSLIISPAIAIEKRLARKSSL